MRPGSPRWTRSGRGNTSGKETALRFDIRDRCQVVGRVPGQGPAEVDGGRLRRLPRSDQDIGPGCYFCVNQRDDVLGCRHDRYLGMFGHPLCPRLAG